MELSSEDELRLNVLLANKPLAIRIDESSMTLYGLSETGEARIKLNPTMRDERYVKLIREHLSGVVLGSPGGYPVYLQRWTRMGQTRDDNLEQLLKLGEPEAVIAVTCAKGLTDELARRAWWIAQEPENARRMLDNPAVVQGDMGSELARFLIEYLPFETEHLTMIENLRLALQPGLISADERNDLWKKCQRKPTYYLGFLASTPDDLPVEAAASKIDEKDRIELERLGQAGNAYAGLLLKFYSPAGQAFLVTVMRVLEKPANQDVVSLCLDVIQQYCTSDLSVESGDSTIEELIENGMQRADAPDEIWEALLSINPELKADLIAAQTLAGLSFAVVRPVFRRTDAIGSLMRKKLEPVMTPLREQISQLIA